MSLGDGKGNFLCSLCSSVISSDFGNGYKARNTQLAHKYETAHTMAPIHPAATI